MSCSPTTSSSRESHPSRHAEPTSTSQLASSLTPGTHPFSHPRSRNFGICNESQSSSVSCGYRVNTSVSYFVEGRVHLHAPRLSWDDCGVRSGENKSDVSARPGGLRSEQRPGQRPPEKRRLSSSSSSRQASSSSSNPKSKGSKRKRRRPKSPGAPRHPVSSFIFFAQAAKDEVQDTKKKGQLMSILGSRWRAMSDAEKAPWVEKGRADVERYRIQKEAYHQRKAAGRAEENPSNSAPGDGSQQVTLLMSRLISIPWRPVSLSPFSLSLSLPFFPTSRCQVVGMAGSHSCTSMALFVYQRQRTSQNPSLWPVVPFRQQIPFPAPSPQVPSLAAPSPRDQRPAMPICLPSTTGVSPGRVPGRSLHQAQAGHRSFSSDPAPDVKERAAEGRGGSPPITGGVALAPHAAVHQDDNVLSELKHPDLYSVDHA